MDSEKKEWGGKREGAGRKPLTINRRQRQTRASDEEWDIILPFVDMLRRGKVPSSWLKKIEEYKKGKAE